MGREVGRWVGGCLIGARNIFCVVVGGGLLLPRGRGVNGSIGRWASDKRACSLCVVTDCEVLLLRGSMWNKLFPVGADCVH